MSIINNELFAEIFSGCVTISAAIFAIYKYYKVFSKKMDCSSKNEEDRMNALLDVFEKDEERNNELLKDLLFEMQKINKRLDRIIDIIGK